MSVLSSFVLFLFLILVCYYQGTNLQKNLQNLSPTLFLEDRHRMSSSSRVSVGYCSVCLRLLPVRLNGKVKKHGPVLNRCVGSGLAPTFVAAPSTPSASQTRNPQNPLDPGAFVSSPSSAPQEVVNPRRPRAKILGRIPRSARGQVARKLAEILDAITSTKSKESWEHLFLLSVRCLHAPPEEGTGGIWCPILNAL